MVTRVGRGSRNTTIFYWGYDSFQSLCEVWVLLLAETSCIEYFLPTFHEKTKDPPKGRFRQWEYPRSSRIPKVRSSSGLM